MIKTLTPYSTTSKTVEIMSRYRPIAPKPEPPAGGDGEPVMSGKIRQSPFMRNIWPQLQARPTRTRKRGRTSTLAPPVFKRQRPAHHQLPQLLGFSPSKALSLHGFVHPQVQAAQVQAQAQVRSMSRLGEAAAPGASIVTLSLLPCQAAEGEYLKHSGEEVEIDLNTAAHVTPHVVPEEKDLLQQLQRPPTPACSNVIAPQPVRPVGSVIRVERINSITTEELGSAAKPGTKTRGEVEQEVESEPLPVVISDSHNKVRMANSAYKEMVGQPECSWLDRMVSGDNGKRIGGEVMLQLSDSDVKVPVSATGFSCWAKVEWGNEGKKSCADAFCDVIRVACESKDYELAWRIRTRNGEGGSPSSSVV